MSWDFLYLTRLKMGASGKSKKWGNHTICSPHNIQAFSMHKACIRLFIKPTTTAFHLSKTYIYKESCILQTSKSLSTAQRDIWGTLLRIQQGGHYQPTFTELSSCVSLFNVWKLTLKQQFDCIVLSGLRSPPNFSESRYYWDDAQLLRWHELTVCL